MGEVENASDSGSDRRRPGLGRGAGASAARAQNLVVNPQFHTGSAGWQLEGGSEPGWTGTDDEGGCAGSGAAVAQSSQAQGGERAAVRQCVNPPGGVTYFARARHKGSGLFTIWFRLFHTTGCDGVPEGSSGSTEAEQSPTEWRTFESSVLVSMDTESVEIELRAQHDTPHELLVDAVELATDLPIFVDDFEGNAGGESQPCRWVAL